MKKVWMILVLGLVLAMTVMPAAGAAKHQNLQGHWQGSWTSFKTTDKINFTPDLWLSIDMTITGQDTAGNFYGTLAFDFGLEPHPVIGNIATNKVVTFAMVGVAGSIADPGATFSFNGKWTGKGIQGVMTLWNPDGTHTLLESGVMNFVKLPN
jgi:hypothetical protein